MKAAKTRARNRKHAGTGKHASKVKHTPTASKKGATAARASVKRVALSASAAKARAWSPSVAYGCCTVDALAASLRLAGWPVGDADVLALYELAADGPDSGTSIWAALDGAYKHGLAGVRPLGYDLADPEEPGVLLLGVDLPGAHTVCAEPAGWWSWGELWQPAAFPDAVIEEAWRVVWPA